MKDSDILGESDLGNAQVNLVIVRSEVVGLSNA